MKTLFIRPEQLTTGDWVVVNACELENGERLDFFLASEERPTTESKMVLSCITIYQIRFATEELATVAMVSYILAEGPIS